MQIVVIQSHGLGNQLFQYAAGRSFAKRYAGSLRIACQPPSQQVADGAPRPLLLHEFNITGRVAQKTKIDRLVLSTKPRYASAARIARAALCAEVIREEPTQFLFHPEVELAHQTRIAYFVGYWQSHQFAQDIESELRKEFRLRTPLTGKNLELANRIRSARMPVSVHLRRGDYATAFGSGVLLPLDYYTRAVQHIAAVEQDCTFFVFSDDKGFAREWARGRSNFVVVDHNDSELLAHEDMRLMSLCRHNIIANSSFSWWGAWLNQNPDKRVIAPAQWLGHETEKTDLLPGDWQVMAC
jgi:Glycosyl transferase family 11